MLKKFFARLRSLWDRQDVAVECDSPVAETSEYTEQPIRVSIPIVEVRRPKPQTPKMSWAELKANNALVNQYFATRSA